MTQKTVVLSSRFSTGFNSSSKPFLIYVLNRPILIATCHRRTRNLWILWTVKVRVRSFYIFLASFQYLHYYSLGNYSPVIRPTVTTSAAAAVNDDTVSTTTDGERKRRSNMREPVKPASSSSISQHRPSAFTSPIVAGGGSGGGGIGDTAATIQQTQKLSQTQLHQLGEPTTLVGSTTSTSTSTVNANANFSSALNGAFPFSPLRK